MEISSCLQSLCRHLNRSLLGSPCCERRVRRGKACFNRNIGTPALALALVLALSGVIPASAQREIDIGDIRVRGDDQVLRVHIQSDADDLRRLAETAFHAHGRFEISREQAGSHFTFVFRSAGSNRVEVDILSGSPPRSQARQSVGGATRRAALFGAADLAVRRTTGEPGIFSGKLAFVGERTGNREIYVASDLFLGETRRVTSDRNESVLPRWTPDGRGIIYTGYFQSGFPDLFRIDLANQRRETFVNMRGTNTGARFDPSGNRVAMVLSGEGTPEIYISNADGRGIRRMTRTNAVQASPTWSPDGSQLAFTSDRDGRPQIFIMSSRGGNMRRVPTDVSRNCSEPDWNPRFANLIAFTAAVQSRFAIVVYDFETRQSTILTRGPGDGVEPVWTADGRHLVYTERTSRTSRLMLLDTKAGRSVALTGENHGKVSMADFWLR